MALKGNYIVYDIETTGLDARQGHEITEIAAIALSQTDLAEHHAGTFHVYLKPQKPELASAKAIEVAGESFERAMSEGLDPVTGLKAFTDWVNTVNDSKEWKTKPFRVGHNIASFDNPFMEFWLEELKICKRDKKGWMQWPWDTRSFDTLQSCMHIFEIDPTFYNYKLDTALGYFSMKRVEKTHSALEDVKLNAQLFARIQKYFRQCYARMRVKENKD